MFGKKLKVFAASCSGHYIGAYSVVVAESEEQAKILLQAALHPLPLSCLELKEIDANKADAIVLTDGDY